MQTPDGSVGAYLFGVGNVVEDLQGLALINMSAVEYSVIRTAPGGLAAQQLTLQAEWDADVTDGDNGWQGRLVHERYLNQGGNTPSGVWQEVDAQTQGGWYTTRCYTTNCVAPDGLEAKKENCCCGQENPCSWDGLRARYPNGGTRKGALVGFKAGSGWAGFAGNVNRLKINDNIITFTVPKATASVVGEPMIEGRNVKFVVSLDFPSKVPLKISYTASGTALGADQTGELEFAVGDSIKTVTVETVEDQVVEVEKVELALEAGEGSGSAVAIGAPVTADVISRCAGELTFNACGFNANNDVATTRKPNELPVTFAGSVDGCGTNDAAPTVAVSDVVCKNPEGKIVDCEGVSLKLNEDESVTDPLYKVSFDSAGVDHSRSWKVQLPGGRPSVTCTLNIINPGKKEGKNRKLQ